MSDRTMIFNKMVQNFLLNREQYLRSGMESPNRNLNTECGYPTDPTIHDYKQWYSREGIATRVVDLLPDETWAVVPEIYETEDSKSTPFEDAWAVLVDEPELNPLHYLHRVDRLSGIGRFGCLLFGFDDGKDLDQPVAGIDGRTGKRTAGRPPKRELLFLRAFDETTVAVSDLETSFHTGRVGKPLYYNITFADMETAEDSVTTEKDTKGKVEKVHWSRVLHVADNRGDSEVYGVPRLQQSINRCFDLRKVLGGSAEMFWKGGFPGYSVEALPDFVGDQLDDDTIKAQFQLFMNGLQRYLAVEGVTIKSLAPQVADPEKHIFQQLLVIAMTIGCPLRVLMGSESGKQAGEQDTARWNGRIARRQLEYVNPFVIRPFVQRLILAGVLPEVKKYYTGWSDLNSVSEKDKADIALKTAQALLQYVSSGAEKIYPLKFFLMQVMKHTEPVADAIVKEAQSPKYAPITKELWKAPGNQLPGSGKNTQMKKGSGQNAAGTGTRPKNVT